MVEDEEKAFNHEEGLRRLKGVFKYAFARVEPGEEPPPVPQEVVDWASATLNGTAGGVILGALRQWWIHRQMGPVVAPADLPSPAHIAKYLADENTKRLSSTLAGSIKAGWQVGSIFAIFCGVDNLSLVYRNSADMWNSTIAATLTGAFAGATVSSGSGVGARVRGAALGSVAAGLLSVPSFWALQSMQAYVPKEHSTLHKKEEMAQKRSRDHQFGEPAICPYPSAPHNEATRVMEQLLANLPPESVLQLHKQEATGAASGAAVSPSTTGSSSSSRPWWNPQALAPRGGDGADVGSASEGPAVSPSNNGALAPRGIDGADVGSASEGPSVSPSNDAASSPPWWKFWAGKGPRPHGSHDAASATDGSKRALESHNTSSPPTNQTAEPAISGSESTGVDHRLPMDTSPTRPGGQWRRLWQASVPHDPQE